jgi:hypothetical protein
VCPEAPNDHLPTGQASPALRLAWCAARLGGQEKDQRPRAKIACGLGDVLEANHTLRDRTGRLKHEPLPGVGVWPHGPGGARAGSLRCFLGLRGMALLPASGRSCDDRKSQHYSHRHEGG